MNCLFPGSDFWIDLNYHRLFELHDGGFYHDWSDQVINWELFETIVSEGRKNGCFLKLEYWRDLRKIYSEVELVFFNPEIGSKGPKLNAQLVIQSKNKEENKSMRYLKEGFYYVSINRKKLVYILNGFEQDYSDLVRDWNLLSKLVRDENDDMIELRINWGETMDETIVMSKFISSKNSFMLNLEDVIYFSRDTIAFKQKEDNQNTSNYGSSPETDPEERIKQLEKEKVELEKIVERNQKYEEFKKSTDEIALLRKAMMDSGFTREETMNIINSAITALCRG